jgi:hypothetical protein
MNEGYKRLSLVVVILLVFAVGAVLVLQPDRPRRLVGSQFSSEGLAAEFLSALRASDLKVIRQLTISEEEWVRYVWPVSAANKPGANLTAEFVWNHMHMRSQAALAAAFSRNKGKSYDLLGLRFAEDPREFPEFTIHRGPRLLVRDKKGEEEELRLFGSVFEVEGEFKIFNFDL